MNRRPNRVTLIIIALLLITVGLIAVLAAAGALPVDQPAELYRQARTGARTYPWMWIGGIIVGGVVLAVVGIWLVRRQFRWRPGGRLDTVAVQRTDSGSTTLQAAAAAKATAADLRHRPAISDSRVRLVTFGSRPRLLVNLEVGSGTPPRQALDAAEEAYARLAGALGVDGVRVETRLRTGDARPSRVR